MDFEEINENRKFYIHTKIMMSRNISCLIVKGAINNQAQFKNYKASIVQLQNYDLVMKRKNHCNVIIL